LPTIPLAARIVLYPVTVLLGLAAIGIALAMIVLALAYPNLPSLESLTDYRPKIPLRVYTSDGYLMPPRTTGFSSMLASTIKASCARSS